MTNRTEQTDWPSKNQKIIKKNLSGLILCGGAARRLGGRDKGLLKSKQQKQSLIEHQIDFVRPQVAELSISANRNIHIYQCFGYPVYPDKTGVNFDGPLQGILTGLQHCKTDWLYVQPIDTPNLPKDTIKQLCQRVEKLNSKIYYLATNERAHYLHLLLHVSCYMPLKYFVDTGERRVRDFLNNIKAEEINLGWQESAFKNLNVAADYDN